MITRTKIPAGSTFGSDAHEIIAGTAQSAFVVGWQGSDIMTGGRGDDTFVFHRGDSGRGPDGRDVITDFDMNGDDHMTFYGISEREVTMKQVAAGVLIEYEGLGSSLGEHGGAEILLKGQVLANIDSSDFVFM